MNELPIGIYDIPKDCRAVVLEGGRQIEIKKKKNIHGSLSFRCKHCKHYVSGHTNYYSYTTMVCDVKPKTFSEWTMKQKMKSRFYDSDVKFYRGAKEYGKPCEMFELKEEKK